MPTPLVDALRAYAAREPARFHMPGHKGKTLPLPELNALAPLDVTELEGRIVCQPEEVADARFLPFEAAVERLTHLSDRETLAAAEAFLAESDHAHPAG